MARARGQEGEVELTIMPYYSYEMQISFSMSIAPNTIYADALALEHGAV